MVMKINQPKISIITPSYNQGQYIEETITSVLDQKYPNTEYIIIDGGSTDETIDIIKKYESSLSYWVSEPDDGQYDAINKGFSKSTGEIMAWINSDDKYTPWTFAIVADIFTRFPEIDWLTTSYPLCLNKAGYTVSCFYLPGFSREAFFKGVHLPCPGRYAHSFIQQESTFWRRSLWDMAGSHIDSSLSLAGDFELWTKFFKYAELYAVAAPLGCFRYHDGQKTAHRYHEYLKEADAVLTNHGGAPYNKTETKFRNILLKLAGPREMGNRYGLLRRLLLRLNIIFPVKRCVWDKHTWIIKKNYII
ncbi:MAG: glycosyltransferase family 2 protein [Desulfomonilia bacterium]|jgi:glycosyltransferase involved in cell wall biosynthesis|nr:glycosyltransferase family 2 protein [Desulfomonilia bacterium]